MAERGVAARPVDDEVAIQHARRRIAAADA